MAPASLAQGDYVGDCKDGCFKLENTYKGYDGTEFQGEGYLRWDGDDSFGNPGKGTVSYDILITNGGKYTFGMHNFHNHPDGSEGNDIFVKIDNLPNTAGEIWDKCFSNEVAVWTMTSMFHHKDSTPAYGLISWELEPGMHTLSISGRSKDFAIDRIHLHNFGYGATDPSVAETQRQGYAVKPTEAPVVVSEEGKHGFVYEVDTDLWLNDLQYGLTATSADDCALKCTQIDGCTAFTYHVSCPAGCVNGFGRSTACVLP